MRLTEQGLRAENARMAYLYGLITLEQAVAILFPGSAETQADDESEAA